MLCQNCGRDIEDNSVFCPFCGTKCESTGFDGKTRQLDTLVLPNQLPQDNTDELNNHIDQQERVSIDSRSSRKLLVFIIISVCVALAALIAIVVMLVFPAENGADKARGRWGNMPANIALADGIALSADDYDYVAVDGDGYATTSEYTPSAKICRVSQSTGEQEVIYELPNDDDASQIRITSLNEYDDRIYFLERREYVSDSKSSAPQSVNASLHCINSDGTDDKTLVSWNSAIEGSDALPETVYLFGDTLYIQTHASDSFDEVRAYSLDGEDQGVVFSFETPDTSIDPQASSYALSGDASRFAVLYPKEDGIELLVQKRDEDESTSIYASNAEIPYGYNNLSLNDNKAYFVEFSEGKASLVTVDLESGEKKSLYSEPYEEGSDFFVLASLTSDTAYLRRVTSEEDQEDISYIAVSLSGDEVKETEISVGNADSDEPLGASHLINVGDRLISISESESGAAEIITLSPDLETTAEEPTYLSEGSTDDQATTDTWSDWGNAPANISIGNGFAVADGSYDYFVRTESENIPNTMSVCRVQQDSPSQMETLFQVASSESGEKRLFGLNVWDGRLYFVSVAYGEYIYGPADYEIHSMALDGTDDRVLATYSNKTGTGAQVEALYLYKGELLVLLSSFDSNNNNYDYVVEALALDGARKGTLFSLSTPGDADIALSDDAERLVAVYDVNSHDRFQVVAVDRNGQETQLYESDQDSFYGAGGMGVVGQCLYLVGSNRNTDERTLLSVDIATGDVATLYTDNRGESATLKLIGLSQNDAYLELSDYSVDAKKPSWCRISLSDGACEELSLPWSEYPYYTVLIDAGDHVIGVRSGEDSYDGVAVYAVRPDGSGPTDYVAAPAL